jgi:hypothetical protein
VGWQKRPDARERRADLLTQFDDVPSFLHFHREQNTRFAVESRKGCGPNRFPVTSLKFGARSVQSTESILCSSVHVAIVSAAAFDLHRCERFTRSIKPIASGLWKTGNRIN